VIATQPLPSNDRCLQSHYLAMLLYSCLVRCRCLATGLHTTISINKIAMNTSEEYKVASSLEAVWLPHKRKPRESPSIEEMKGPVRLILGTEWAERPKPCR
jgi:hypothetical protein